MDEGKPMTDIFNTPAGLFDLHHLLVEIVFGSVGAAVIGIALVLLVILLICRSSLVFIVMWLTFYFGVMATVYVGGIGLVILTVFGSVSIGFVIIRWFFREGG